MEIARHLPPLSSGYNTGFVCIQYRTPMQIKRNQWSTHGLCLLCLRKRISIEYFWKWQQHQFKNKHHMPMNIPFYNIVDKPGEYDSSFTLDNSSALTGILLPFVQYQRHHYTYSEKTVGLHKIRIIQQDAIRYLPGRDFGLPLTI
jgi:hypothetical protein